MYKLFAYLDLDSGRRFIRRFDTLIECLDYMDLACFRTDYKKYEIRDTSQVWFGCIYDFLEDFINIDYRLSHHKHVLIDHGEWYEFEQAENTILFKKKFNPKWIELDCYTDAQPYFKT